MKDLVLLLRLWRRAYVPLDATRELDVYLGSGSSWPRRYLIHLFGTGICLALIVRCCLGDDRRVDVFSADEAELKLVGGAPYLYNWYCRGYGNDVRCIRRSIAKRCIERSTLTKEELANLGDGVQFTWAKWAFPVLPADEFPADDNIVLGRQSYLLHQTEHTWPDHPVCLVAATYPLPWWKIPAQRLMQPLPWGLYWAAAVVSISLFIALVITGKLVAGAVKAAAAFGRAVRLYRAWRRVSSRKIIRTKEPSGELIPIAAVLSDTHVTASPKLLPVELRTRGLRSPITGASIRETLIRSRDLIAAETLPLVLCGDITDTGGSDEWAFVTELFREFQPSLFLVPGNHDIALSEASGRDLAARSERELNVLRFADSRQSQSVAVALNTATLVSFAPDCHLILIDSNGYRTTNLASNAIGLFGHTTLRRIQYFLEERNVGDVVVVCHHHLGVISDETVRLAEDPWIIAIDGDHLLGLLVAHSRRERNGRQNRVLLVHGHRHVMYHGQYTATDGPSGVRIVGMPSSTMGTLRDRGELDGIGRIGYICRTATGDLDLSFKSIADVADQRPT